MSIAKFLVLGAAGIPVGLLVLLLANLGASSPSAGPGAEEWPAHGHDSGGARYSPLAQIDRSNVARLVRAWSYRTGERQVFQCTPLVIEGVLYLSTPSSRVIALEAESGRELWSYRPPPVTGRARPAEPHRGVAFWTQGERRRLFFGTNDGRLIALEAQSGQPALSFGEDGMVDLRAGMGPGAEGLSLTSPPAIYRNLVIVGGKVPEGVSRGPSGDVRAFDALTGKEVWRFHTVPRPGERGFDTWAAGSTRDRTGVNVWSIISVDLERGLLFLPTGSASYDFYGGDRAGDNLFANSLVALEAGTGKLRWYRQLIHHDIWDRDLPAQPNLVTVRRQGRSIPAVAQVTKTGHVFVFDRSTGEPIFPVEERAVPKSGVPGEAASPTQPIPVKPPPFARQTMTREEISDVTPESHRACKEIFDRAVVAPPNGPYGRELTIVFPGTLGGGSWSGASFDPRNGLLYVNANELGALGRMVPGAGDGVSYRRASPWGEYARFWDDKRWPCQKPPWGTLTAVDLNRGRIAWQVPLGTVDELAARGLARTGTPNLGGTIVTAGGLVFVAATNDRRFRAFDARSGAELWVTTLEASGHATPITFLGRKNRRQFVVIASGGAGKLSPETDGLVAAYSLPD